MKQNTKKYSCNPEDAKEKKMDKEEMGPIENNNKIGDLNAMLSIITLIQVI